MDSLHDLTIGAPDDAHERLLQFGTATLSSGGVVGLGDGTESKLYLDSNGVAFKNASGFLTHLRCTGATADHNLEFHYTAGTGKHYPELIATLASDATNATVTPAAVSSFEITLAASGLYEFDMLLVMESADAVTSPRLSIEGPTAQTDLVSFEIVSGPNATTVTNPGQCDLQVFDAWGEDFVNANNPPAINTPYLFRVRGICKMTATTPASTVSLEIWSETGGKTITLKAGSFMRFRKLN